jgi:tetratricopeptide (TPR) repeat protein/glycosyltransferase involved in cell wall biosynthesis
MKNLFQQAYDLYSNGNLSEAKEQLEILLKEEEKNIIAIYLHGIIDFRLENFESAKEYFSKSAELNPGHAESLYNLALCYANSGDDDKAIECYIKALERNPKHSNSLNNLGALYYDKKNYDEAEKLYLQALSFEPNNTNAISNLGNVKLSKNKPEEAIEYYKKAINTKSAAGVDFNYANAYNNIGFVKMEYGVLEECYEYFDRASEIDPEYAEPHFNKARAYLLSGRLVDGWREYEWRLKREEYEKRTFSKPMLTNQNIKGKTILACSEQGLGDTINFMRYLPMLKDAGCRVIFECHKKVMHLVKDYYGFDEIIEQKLSEEPAVDYDYHIPLMSLPNYFKTDINHIPGGTPYIFADEELVEYWKNIIQKDDSFKVGIVWAGNPSHIRDDDRSCRISDFLPLFSIEGAKIYILQKGAATEQTNDIVNPYVDLNQFGFDEKLPFSDSAAIIENLDLVVTVDTSITHLAGAMNKPVWALLSYIPDWRWMLGREDTPWYPSMRLIRQTKNGDWKQVFQFVREEIIKKINGSKAAVSSNTKNDGAAVTDEQQRIRDTFYLGLPTGENFGWGVCGAYLRKELSKKVDIINVDENSEILKSGKADGSLFQALSDINFTAMVNVRGKRNYSYTFFENELNDNSIENAKKYDLVFAGSSWCRDKMIDKGIYNSGILIQGIDPELFYPIEEEKTENLFTIYSGGKFELRKGQDIVLRAFDILQKKHDDVILINTWYNIWPATMQPMTISPFIKFELKGNNWINQMRHICAINDIAGERIFTLPLSPNNKMRELYKKTDIGLFPNRCEGGTNLVLMEYMASGKPVIASYNTGHEDVLTEDNSYPLTTMKDFQVYDNEDVLMYDWKEPDLDEVVAQLEFAYNNRDAIKAKGKIAGEEMKQFTWDKSAESLLQQVKL